MAHVFGVQDTPPPLLHLLKDVVQAALSPRTPAAEIIADDDFLSAAAVAAKADGSTSSSGAPFELGPGSFSPFIVVNESGSPLQVWSPSATGALLGRSAALSASAGGASSASLPLLVRPGTQAPLSAAFLGLRSGDDRGASAAAFAERYLLGRPEGGAGEAGGATAALDWECDPPDDAGRAFSAPFAPAAAAAASTFDEEADAASADVISPAVTVLLSLQLEGFQPLRRVVVSRAGVTRAPLHLLRAGQADDRGVALLTAPAPLAAAAAAAATDTALGCWAAALRVASTTTTTDAPGAPPYGHVELLVEDGPGGCKVLRVRSLVTVRSRYMMEGEGGLSCHPPC